MRVASLAIFVFTGAIGCSSPIAPSVENFPTDTRIENARALVGRSHPNVSAIRFVELPSGISARYQDGEVWISTLVADSRPTILAGLIAHEYRHADGILHDCGSKDKRLDGAWNAHAEMLDALGENETAGTIRANQFCD